MNNYNLPQLLSVLSRHPFYIFDSNLEKLLESKNNEKYPPFNVVFNKENTLGRIEVALAGFKESEVLVEYNESTKYLTIKSSFSGEESERLDENTYYHKGISKKPFIRSFKLDSFEPSSAKFEEGLLIIEIMKSQETVRKIEFSKKDDLI